MKAHNVWLSGIGVYAPPAQVISQAETTSGPGGGAWHGQPDRVARVCVAGDMSAPDMALHAARRALASSAASPRDVALLIYADVWHQGPDGWAPHSYLQRLLHLDRCLAVEQRAGCTGGFSAIELAVGYLQQRAEADVALVVTSDNFGTKLVDRWCMGPLQGAVGDGAAALVVSRRPGFARVLSTAGATFAEMEAAHREGEPLFPPPVTEGRYMDLGIRAARFQARAIRDGRWMSLSLGHLERAVGVVEEALADAGSDRRDISRVLIHSMPEQAATSYLESLGFTLDRSSWSLAEAMGHVGASDHVLALHHLLVTGQVRHSDRVLLTGFSPGITYKAMVVEITDTGPLRGPGPESRP
ncbi:MAG TPA: ketoacyl-ACP synthase III family protein [Trebonia sp.]|nr:ketoacyl-ACP synthase III family protein [Trebonia sp.]